MIARKRLLTKTTDSQRFRRLSKEGFWIVLGQALAVLGSLVGVRLLTELLDPSAYGELALGLAVGTLVNQLILGPLSNGINRFYAPAAERGDLTAYLNAVRRLVVSASQIIVLLMLVAVIGLLIAGRKDRIAIATSALIFATLTSYNAIVSGILNAARQRSVVAIHQGIESWARYLAAAALMVWLGATSTVAMLGFVMAIMMVLGSQYLCFLRIVGTDSIAATEHKGWSEQIWKYSWPFAAWGVFSWAQQVSDRWGLEFFATTREVGLYAVLSQLGYYPISMVTGMAMQFFAPIFYQRAGDASDGRRNAGVNNLSWRLTALALAGTGAAFLVAVLFHAQIFAILAAKEYQSVSRLLPWVMVAGGLFAAGQTLSLNLMSQMKTRSMLAAKIITALLGILFNFAGAYWYGTTGIVIAGVLFSLLYCLWMVVLQRSSRSGQSLQME